jgi:hypothetical protein
VKWCTNHCLGECEAGECEARCAVQKFATTNALSVCKWQHLETITYSRILRCPVPKTIILITC